MPLNYSYSDERTVLAGDVLRRAYIRDQRGGRFSIGPKYNTSHLGTEVLDFNFWCRKPLTGIFPQGID
jgi:hypothetical protein